MASRLQISGENRAGVSAPRLSRAIVEKDAATWAVEEVAGCAGVGSAYLYRRVGTRWRQLAHAPASRQRRGPWLALVRRAAAEERPVGDGPTVAVALTDGQPWVLVIELEVSPGPGELLPRVVAERAELARLLLLREQELARVTAEARRDPLTGLGNRRAFEEHLAGIEREPFSVLFCDLDAFKLINDRDGYSGGDRTLREVARVLTSELRPGEELFRIGGDEFAVVVFGSRPAALAVADRMSDALGRRRRGPSLPTLSVGVVTSSPQAAGAEQLLAGAAEDLAARRAHSLRQTRPETGALRVLVVDDDPALRLLLKTTFEAVHLTVDLAGSVAEAREAVAHKRPNVIVLDVSMPGEDGLALARELTRMPATTGIAIVF